ncbi:MAG TPA: precorrin-6A reductase [Syntrophus sp. (in: bacteria)]|nr:precorrin-6A reductase [Syntrophus sp. (in: bacteria)]
MRRPAPPAAGLLPPGATGCDSHAEGDIGYSACGRSSRHGWLPGLQNRWPAREHQGVVSVILLLGGTSETAPLAAGMVKAGFAVLVSTATDIPLELDDHPQLRRRSGPLDAPGLEELIRDNAIGVLVDATHPYATAISVLAAMTARRLSVPCLTFVRPGIDAAMVSDPDGITFAADHDEAARLACAGGKAVLLTTGSRNLRPYAEEAKRTGAPLIVRVLSHPDSLAACRAAGIPPEMVIAAKGPFSVEENVNTIRKFGIAVLVTKDSGAAGAVPEKIAAAKLEKCRMIVIGRPLTGDGPVFQSIEKLIKYLEMNKQMR